MPEWIGALLKELGLPGAIIFVLMGVITIESEIIRRLIAHANKVYGFRLAERDTLNKALTDSAKVLADMLEATRDRNDITEELGDLIAKQTAAFELLRVTIANQYENIRQNNADASLAVGSMSESIRALAALVTDGKNAGVLQTSDVKSTVDRIVSDVKEFVRVANMSQIAEIRNIMGVEVTVVKRRGRTQ